MIGRRVGRVGWVGLGVLSASMAVSALVSCTDTKQKGGLMLAVNTDMKAPKDVNVITLSVLVNNQVKVNYQGRVTPDGKVLLPATVALAEPSDANASIRIRVVAFQERKARVLRDVRTTIPSGGRIALLRLPLNFVNDGSGQGELPVGFVVDDKPISNTPTSSGGSSSGSSGGSSGGGIDGGNGIDGGGSSSSASSASGGSNGGSSSGDIGAGGGGFGSGELNPYEIVSSSCLPDQTVIEGECKDDFVDSSTLPDYEEALVGKGDDPASCFDVKKAFANATHIEDGQNGDKPPVSSGEDAGTAAPVDAGMGDKDFHIQAITLDRAACALNLGGEQSSQLNIAIVTSDTGECIRPGECYIPIDNGEGGWTESNGRVQLPSFVCTLINKKGLRLATSIGQPSKKSNNPICAETVVSPTPIADSGVPPQDVKPVKVIPEEFATTVLTTQSGDTLYFAGANRIGRATIDPATGLLAGTPTGMPLPSQPPPPTGEQPWTFSRSVTDHVILTNASSVYAYVAPFASDAAFQSVNVTNTPVNYGAQATNGAWLWAVGGVNSGVYQTFGVETTRVFFVPDTEKDISLVLASTPGTGQQQNAFVYFNGSGDMKACSFETSQCLPIVSFGSRVDDIAGSPVGAIALTQTGLKQMTNSGTPTIGASLDAQTASEDRAGASFRHQIAGAGACVYFTSKRGVEWASTDLSRSGVLVPATTDKPVLGLAIGRANSGSAGSAGYAIYYTLYAPLNADGGVWKVGPPAECGGFGNGGDIDASAGSDSGTIFPDASVKDSGPACFPQGFDCQTPDQCCTMNCFMNVCGPPP